jgi:hypothetical protein
VRAGSLRAYYRIVFKPRPRTSIKFAYLSFPHCNGCNRLAVPIRRGLLLQERMPAVLTKEANPKRG